MGRYILDTLTMYAPVDFEERNMFFLRFVELYRYLCFHVCFGVYNAGDTMEWNSHGPNGTTEFSLYYLLLPRLNWLYTQSKHAIGGCVYARTSRM